MPERTTIIWDWNGTLLDDAEVCREAINHMLKIRGLPQLSLSDYRNVFTFPVIDYYTAVGFDFHKEDWHTVAMEFINSYLSLLPQCTLAPFVVETLENFMSKGYRQAIISAMQHEELIKSVSALKIDSYFDYTGGIGNHYGGGKIDNARNYFTLAGLKPEEVTLIGDTIHDSEVAAELGCKCILVASGHQSKERLFATGVTVLNDLSEVNQYF